MSDTTSNEEKRRQINEMEEIMASIKAIRYDHQQEKQFRQMEMEELHSKIRSSDTSSRVSSGGDRSVYLNEVPHIQSITQLDEKETSGTHSQVGPARFFVQHISVGTGILMGHWKTRVLWSCLT